MTELEHIGIAVGDLESTLRVLEDVLQVAPYKAESVEKDRIRTHFVRGGGAKLELLESLDAGSPVARFVEKHGPGLHHLAFEVDDIDEAHRRLTGKGYKPLDAQPRAGADGKRIFFLHPKDTAGVLVELCQTEKSVLSEPERIGELLIRTSGSDEGRCVAYFHGPEADPSPDVLARVLEQRFTFRSIEAGADVDQVELSKTRGDASAIVASHDLVPPALRLAVDVRPTALILIHPPERLWPVQLSCPVLIIGQDGPGLDAALEARASIPGSGLAIVPGDDPVLLSRLLERHLAAVQGIGGSK